MKKLAMLITTFVIAHTAWAGSEDKFNVYFNPLGLAIGSLNLGVDYAVAPDWSVGAYGSYINIKYPKSGSFTADTTVKGNGVGVKGTWYASGVYTTGWYVSPQMSYQTIKVEAKNTKGDLTGDGSGTYVSALGGYGWFWDSFNMSLGAGVSVPLGKGKVEIKDSTGGSPEETTVYSTLAAEFNLGWSF